MAVASDVFKQIFETKEKEEVDSRFAGEQIVEKSILAPIKQIAENAGKDGSVILYEIIKRQQEEKNHNIGYNAAIGVFEDMMKAGIVDPTKVVRWALQNAASAASMFLTTEAVVTDIPEKKDGHEYMPQMGGGMPMM